MNENFKKSNRLQFSSKLRKVSKIYKIIGGMFIVIGLFLLFGSIIAAFNGERITSEPVVGGFALLGGLPCFFAAYVGEAIDDIRNNTSK